MKMHCSSPEDKRNTFGCLKQNWDQIDDHRCRGLLFKRVQMEAIEGINMALMSRCERMVQRYCASAPPYQMIDCLIDSLTENSDFDHECGVLVHRAQETKGKDIRLNPHLLMTCSSDLMKYCQKQMPDPFSTLMDPNSEVGQGHALGCLRRVFANETLNLEKPCHGAIRRFIKQSRSNYKQDFLLAKNCRREISEYCSHVPDDQVENCLKKSYYETFPQLPNPKRMSQQCILQIARLLGEARADVHTDSDLYNACADDIVKYCQVPPGKGRVMGCLLAYADSSDDLLTKHCKEMVEIRREMWSYAAQPAPLQSVAEVASIVNESPIKTTVLLLMFAAVFMSICIGCVCGRATKRVQREMKNR